MCFVVHKCEQKKQLNSEKQVQCLNSFHCDSSVKMVINVVEKVSSSNLLKQVLVALSCNLFCIASGCTIGFSAVLLPQIKRDHNFPYSESYDSWIASSPCPAMAFGCIAAGFITDKYGRKNTHIIVATPFLIGWIVLAFANDIILLLIGRVLTGLSTGVFRSLGAVYLGEIASPTNRPLLIFSLSLSATSGIFFSHILGGYLSWRLSCLIICLPTVLGICLQVYVKESPLWLIYKGRIDKGTQAFIWYRGNDTFSQKELADTLEIQKDRPPNLTFKEGLKALFSKAFLLPLLTAFLLFVTVQFNGVNNMSFYAQDLLKTTFSGEQDPFMLMLVTDSVRVIGVAVLFSFSKYIPRRKTYLITCATVVILLIALNTYIAVKPSGLAWLAITILLIYVALGSLIVSLSWTFVGEIFPSNLRGLGSGIGASSSFILLFLSVNITPGLMLNYGIIATYSTFAVVTFLGSFLLYFLLPHTDGKTLQEIENSYDKK